MVLNSAQLGYISRAPNVGIDKPTLTRLAEMIEGKSDTILLGFNDYTKHLINMFCDNIRYVVDPKYAGVEFRGVTVRPLGEFERCGQMLVCSYPDFMVLKEHYFAAAQKARVPYLFPDKYGADTTKIVDFWRLDPLYKKIIKEAADCPPSMMSEPGLFFRAPL